jgi:hypothetical protein
MGANTDADRRPEHIALLMVWLASPESQDITGRVFNVGGGNISVAEGWHAGPGITKDALWTVEELRSVIPDLVAQAAPNANTQGQISEREG